MQPLIKDNLNNFLSLIVTKLFEGNRIIDRGMSILDVKFAMNNTVEFLHPKLAHLFPLKADNISEYQSSRNCLTIYGQTPLDDSDYIVPLDFFIKMLQYQQELESVVSEGIDLCKDEDDRMTKVFLESFLLGLIPITKQISLLIDKSEAYGNDSKSLMDFDHNVEDFIIL